MHLSLLGRWELGKLMLRTYNLEISENALRPNNPKQREYVLLI